LKDLKKKIVSLESNRDVPDDFRDGLDTLRTVVEGPQPDTEDIIKKVLALKYKAELWNPK